MSRADEWIPWYRREDYSGNLTEEEKRHLDSFRLEKKHPAAAFEDLPKEVSVYDAKEDAVATKAFVLTGIGAFVIVLAYRELGPLSQLFEYVGGGAIIAFAWIIYSRERKKIADEFWNKREGKGAPFSRTEENLQRNWELNEIIRYRRRHETEIDKH